MRILVVEDETDVANAVARRLENSDFAVDRAASLCEANEAVCVHRYSLVLLDRRLPDGDGLSLLPKLRSHQPAISVLVLTANDAKGAIVEALDKGADDYICKPFDSDELMARVRASLRRSGRDIAPRIRVGEISFDPNLRDVSIRGQSILIHGRELMLLEVLMRNAERTVSRETIIDEIYGFDNAVQSSALNSLVMRLRNRLSELNAGVSIHMARGVGYMLRKVPT